ncbi:MAG: GNAT family N-acetyltransferase [Clostridiales bacterium]|jgi:ribosomal protein S18 acetylase RimI-like enzyme|nr:GNAT family N-acetyltransferase [Clostridiales bacterium]
MSNNQKIMIRPIQEGDVDLIYDYFLSHSEETKRFFTPHAMDRACAEWLTQEDRLDPDTHRFVAVKTDAGAETIVGYVFFWKWTKMVPWFGIAVRDGYKGQGLGTLMMQHAIDEAKKHHKGGILLTTATDNVRAQALYRKFGYEIIGKDERGEYLMILNFPDTLMTSNDNTRTTS